MRIRLVFDQKFRNSDIRVPPPSGHCHWPAIQVSVSVAIRIYPPTI